MADAVSRGDLQNEAGIVSAKWHKTNTCSSATVLANETAASIGKTARTSDRKSDQHYRAVVAVRNGRWRVIVCRDAIQWILQLGKSNGHGTAWRDRSYCRTKSALKRICAQHVGEIEPFAFTILNALPNRIEDRAAEGIAPASSKT